MLHLLLMGWLSLLLLLMLLFCCSVVLLLAGTGCTWRTGLGLC